MSSLEGQSVLPLLRPELQIKPGVRELDGSKTWLIFDPLRHQYFQINTKNKEILELWSSPTAGDVVAQLQGLSVTLDDIEKLLKFFWQNSLTIQPPNDDLDFYLKQAAQKTAKPIKRMLHGYLFLRIPLLRPHRFLKSTEPFTKIFFTRTWWAFIAITAVLGLFLTSRQWDQFTHTFTHFLSMQGLMFYGVALVFVKCLHELGHGYAATRYGCRITSMGIALIVMFPVLFTDTTDAWKLTSRRKRLIIGAAGVAVELSIAAIATLMWALLDDGALRSTAFFIATTSWIMSLMVNLNPFMRFDAYYLLSDALGVQNLQARSFGVGRWSLREFLFGLNESPPEAIQKSKRNGLIVFAWATWIYRFFLFAGIALLIHTMVFRPFGTFLAAVELLFFIAIPIMNELKQWWLRKTQLFKSANTWVSVSFLIAFLCIALVPWQSTVRIPAVIEAANQAPLYAPRLGKIVATHVEQGDIVEQGDKIMTLGSLELENQIVAAQRRIDLVNALLNRVAADSDDRGQKIVFETELRQWQQQLSGLQEQQDLLHIVAPIRGVVAELDSNLHVGRWVEDNARLGSVVSDSGARIRGYVGAADLGRIKAGETAVFIPELPERDRMTGTLSIVERANAEELTIPELTSHYQGPIAVSVVEDKLKPLKAWYHINVDVDSAGLGVQRAERGTLLAEGEPESLALRFWRRAVHVVLREVFI